MPELIIKDGKVYEVTEKEYTEKMIDERIKDIDMEMDNFQNEIDRLNKDKLKWNDKKSLLLKEVVKK